MKFLATLLLTASTAVFAGDLPDPKFTPGVINPDVTQENIGETICKIGYTKTIRPPASYTNKLKLTQMVEQNIPGEPPEYEEDHLISLELGGHPTDPRNLWPEPWVSESGAGARTKDVLETFLKRQVCAGRMPLAEAQQAIASNWIEAYHKYIPAKKQKF